ncbi:ATP synthase subunit I [Thiomicrospira cyclica]|nr:ATP synthase subunit I [Thiomicrospira cyclica]
MLIMANGSQKSLLIQLGIGVVVVLIFAFWDQAGSAIYGMLIGLANVLMLTTTFRIANKRSETDPKIGMLVLYMSAVIRFVLLAALFIIGLALFKFEALPVVITFIAMTIGQIFNLAGKRRLTD